MGRRAIVTYKEGLSGQTARHISLPFSKSQIAREAVIAALKGELSPFHSDLKMALKGEEASDDIQAILNGISSQYDDKVYLKDSGTALRLLLGYFALKTDKPVLVSGSERLCKRPIGPLVEALKRMGADILYQGREGFAPVLISPAGMLKSNVSIDPSLSSQFVTSLMLIGPYIKGGLNIRFTKDPTSVPYILMTKLIMEKNGAEVNFTEDRDGVLKAIDIEESSYRRHSSRTSIERDWSSAAFFFMYEAIAKHPGPVILEGLSIDSVQGDRKVCEYFQSLGVLATQLKEGVLIDKLQYIKPSFIEADFEGCPDIVPAWAVTAALLNIPFKITGIDNLIIKESNRIESIKEGLSAFGHEVESRIENKKIVLIYRGREKPIEGTPLIDTYNDHRIAMAFSMASVNGKEVEISNILDADKSYPSFIRDIEKCGLQIRDC